MIKQKTLLLVGSTIIGSMLVTGLFFVSSYSKNIAGGFERIIKTHMFTSGRILDVKNNSWYIAGDFNGRCHLGNKKASGILLSIDSSMLDTSIIHLIFRIRLRFLEIHFLQLIHRLYI